MLTLLLPFWAVNLLAQDTYQGKFSHRNFYIGTESPIPVGNHTGYDADEGLTISIKYGKNAFIRTIQVKKHDKIICDERIRFPIKESRWIQIKKGLWINSVKPQEQFATAVNDTATIKMHYAGFLRSGEPFDNSFIRNLPLTGNLGHFIAGFSLGAVNVMPNTVRILKIAPELAYGPKGFGNIPGNATIYYVLYNLENPSA